MQRERAEQTLVPWSRIVADLPSEIAIEIETNIDNRKNLKETLCWGSGECDFVSRVTFFSSLKFGSSRYENWAQRSLSFRCSGERYHTWCSTVAAVSVMPWHGHVESDIPWTKNLLRLPSFGVYDGHGGPEASRFASKEPLPFTSTVIRAYADHPPDIVRSFLCVLSCQVREWWV